MYQHIPEELKALPQWVNAKLAKRGPKLTKIPVDPKNVGRTAAVDDPHTWGTFEQAARNVADGLMPLIGFVFTADDPFCGIDLDGLEPEAGAELTVEEEDVYADRRARAERIVDTANSYTETSPSGRGLHVIVLANLGKGRRRDGIEIYSQGRFFTFTGHTVHEPARPVGDAQKLVETLASQMNLADDGSEYSYEGGDGTSQLTDIEVLDMAMNAANADKFCRLFVGRWEGEDGWPSWSQADLALMSMFCYYTDNDEQCKRLFLKSGLATRDKALRPDYLQGMVRKFRTKQPPRVDVSALVSRAAAATPAPTINAEGDAPATDYVTPDAFSFPCGLVGEIAEYVYSSANRPVKEIALATGLALVAGIAGRAWNISNTGVNLYLTLLAETGTGKEAIKDSMERLITELREATPPMPAADQFIGPAMFASGPAFVRVLDERPCFVSVIGEFGLALKRWCADNAPAPIQQLRSALLDVFMKSGRTNTLRPSVYADKEKDTKLVRAPSVTILGESTPLRFYQALEDDGVSEGFVPRFSVIEYTGPRVPKNPNHGHPPPPELVQHLRDVLSQSLMLQQQGQAQDVDYTEDALALLDDFDRECDVKINTASHPVVRELWTRAHLKALRLAALLAVSVNHLDPVIYPEDAEWAMRFIRHEVDHIGARFESGRIGEGGEASAEDALRKAFTRFQTLTPENARAYKVADRYLGSGCMPMPFLRCVLGRLAYFKNARIGASNAIRQYVEEQVRSGMLAKVDEKTVRERFGTVTDLYCPGEDWN